MMSEATNLRTRKVSLQNKNGSKSEGHRDSIYRVLIAFDTLSPISVLEPCITLIKEIDLLYRRVNSQRSQVEELIILASSMIQRTHDQLGRRKERSKFKNLLKPTQRKSYEDNLVITEPEEFANNIEKILRDLKAYCTKLIDISLLKRILQEGDIQKTITEFKERLTKIAEDYHADVFIRLDLWTEDFENAKVEDSRRHEELMKEFQQLCGRFEVLGEDVLRVMNKVGPVDRVKNSDHFLCHDDYVQKILPDLLKRASGMIESQFLNKEQLQFVDEIIRSENSTGTYPVPELRVACKAQGNLFFVKKYRSPDPKYIPNLLREVKHCQALDHPNVVRFYGINTTINWSGEKSVNFVLEYCGRGCLEKYLRDELNPKKKGKQEGIDLFFIIYEIALAVQYLHSGVSTDGIPLLHNDIRLSKVLMSSDRHAKLTGFRRSTLLKRRSANASMSKYQRSMTPMASVAYSSVGEEEGSRSRFRAPETINKPTDAGEPQSGNHSMPSDVYAWAITAGTILCTAWDASEHFKVCPPFKGFEDPFYLKASVLAGRQPFDDSLLESQIPNLEIGLLLKRCWSRNPANRPKISEVVEKLRETCGYVNDESDLRDFELPYTPDVEGVLTLPSTGLRNRSRHPNGVEAGEMTYTTSTGADGRRMFHLFRSEQMVFKGPQGLFHGTHWMIVDVLDEEPEGLPPASVEWIRQWAKNHKDPREVSLWKEWIKMEELREAEEEDKSTRIKAEELRKTEEANKLPGVKMKEARKVEEASESPRIRMEEFRKTEEQKNQKKVEEWDFRQWASSSHIHNPRPSRYTDHAREPFWFGEPTIYPRDSVSRGPVGTSYPTSASYQGTPYSMAMPSSNSTPYSMGASFPADNAHSFNSPYFMYNPFSPYDSHQTGSAGTPHQWGAPSPMGGPYTMGTPSNYLGSYNTTGTPPNHWSSYNATDAPPNHWSSYNTMGTPSNRWGSSYNLDTSYPTGSAVPMAMPNSMSTTYSMGTPMALPYRLGTPSPSSSRTSSPSSTGDTTVYPRNSVERDHRAYPTPFEPQGGKQDKNSGESTKKKNVKFEEHLAWAGQSTNRYDESRDSTDTGREFESSHPPNRRKKKTYAPFTPGRPLSPSEFEPPVRELTHQRTAFSDSSPFCICPLDALVELEYLPDFPAVLASRDGDLDDWKSLMDLLKELWTTQPPKYRDAVGSKYIRTRKSVLVVGLINLWNTEYFHPRKLELVLFEGEERLTDAGSGSSYTRLMQLIKDEFGEESDDSDASSSGYYTALDESDDDSATKVDGSWTGGGSELGSAHGSRALSYREKKNQTSLAPETKKAHSNSGGYRLYMIDIA